MGSLFSPKKPPAPVAQAATATNNVNTGEAEKAGQIRRRYLGDRSSYKNTILAGNGNNGQSQAGYSSGDKTLLSQ